MKYNTRIFIFLGIDGSGKTSHALSVMQYLKSQGKKVKYVWLRRFAFISLPFLAFSRVIGTTKVYKFHDGRHWLSDYHFYKYNLLKLIWPLLQYIDSFFYTILFIYLALYIDKNLFIIVDRGMIDVLVDVLADTRSLRFLNILEKIFVRSLPSNSSIMVFDVSEAIAMERKKDIINIEYLKIRRKIYMLLAKRNNWPIIHTHKDFTFTNKKVIDWVRKNLIC